VENEEEANEDNIFVTGLEQELVTFLNFAFWVRREPFLFVAI